MRITIGKPLSPSGARLVVLGILLAAACLIAGHNHLLPVLDRWTEGMVGKKQGIENKIQQQNANYNQE
jgi:hypothetical protein